jgi:2-phospho-L-lactate guanylyltransferase
VLAIVPVNAPADAKRRLAPVLYAEQRGTLVLAMLEDVLESCRRATALDRVLVVTPDPATAPPDAAVLLDPGRGHAAAIQLALAQAAEDGALVVMADCPLVRPETLDRLASSARPVAVAPAQDGGTNGLALRPADVILPAFGMLDGARIVIERCRAAGIEPAVVDDPALALDVDTPADLERVLELGDGTRTQLFLDRVLNG